MAIDLADEGSGQTSLGEVEEQVTENGTPAGIELKWVVEGPILAIIAEVLVPPISTPA